MPPRPQPQPRASTSGTGPYARQQPHVPVFRPANANGYVGKASGYIVNEEEKKEKLVGFTRIATTRAAEELKLGDYVRFENVKDHGLRLGGVVKKITNDYAFIGPPGQRKGFPVRYLDTDGRILHVFYVRKPPVEQARQEAEKCATFLNYLGEMLEDGEIEMQTKKKTRRGETVSEPITLEEIIRAFQRAKKTKK